MNVFHVTDDKNEHQWLIIYISGLLGIDSSSRIATMHFSYKMQVMNCFV